MNSRQPFLLSALVLLYLQGPVQAQVIVDLGSTGLEGTCAGELIDQIANNVLFDEDQYVSCLESFGVPTGCASRAASLDREIVQCNIDTQQFLNPACAAPALQEAARLLASPACLGGGVGTAADPLVSTSEFVFQTQVVPSVLPRLTREARPAAQPYHSIDASLAIENWSFGRLDGSTLEMGFGYEGDTDRDTTFAQGQLLVFSPDDTGGPQPLNLSGGEAVRLAGGVSWDFSSAAAGAFGGLHLSGLGDRNFSGILGAFARNTHRLAADLEVSYGATTSALLSRLNQDSDIEFGLGFVYGASIGAPIEERFAVNLQVYRTTILSSEAASSFGELDSFTTLGLAGQIAVSPSFVLDIGWRTRFEIDNYDANAFLIGMTTPF